MKSKRNQPNLVKRLGTWALVVVAVLTIPFITNAPWTSNDFIFAGVVLFSLATVYELLTRSMSNKNHRIAVGFGVATVLLCIWAWAVA